MINIMALAPAVRANQRFFPSAPLRSPPQRPPRLLASRLAALVWRVSAMQGEEKTPVEGEDVARGDEAAVEEEETAAAWKRAQSRKWLRTLLSRKLLNKRLIVHWPQLLLVPLFPSLVAVCTIFFSSLVLNLAELQCVRPLQRRPALAPARAAAQAQPGQRARTLRSVLGD